MAVESQEEKVSKKEQMVPDVLKKRRILIAPRSTTVKPRLPQFPNFPLINEQSNDNLSLNTTATNSSTNAAESLPIPEPLTMSKSASQLRNHNQVRRKVDALPVNLTPAQSQSQAKDPFYDYYYYYDDYYDDEYYDDIKEPAKPAFKPISPKKPYQDSRPPYQDKPRGSPPKSQSYSKWAKGEKITRLTPPRMSNVPLPKKKAPAFTLRKRLNNHRLQPQSHNLFSHRGVKLPTTQDHGVHEF